MFNNIRMRFLSTVISLLFLLRISPFTVHSVISDSETHYGPGVKRIIRQLERKERKLVHRLCDIEFLKTCIAYKLYPKMTRFRLHRPENQNLPQVERLRLIKRWIKRWILRGFIVYI